MKNISIFILLAASLLGGLVCNADNKAGTDGKTGGKPLNVGNETGADDRTDGGLFNVVSVTPKKLPTPRYDVADTAVKAVANGANGFAFRLGAALIKDYKEQNFVVSPFSVWMPLAALTNVSADQLTGAHLAALGAAGISTDDINRAASRMLYDLTTRMNGHNPLQIVNAVFVDNKATLCKNFAQTYTDYYRGSSINVEFSSHSAVDAVNRWA